MIAVCKKHRDKALISMLYDTGGRISELLTVNIGSITFPKQSGLHYAEIKLNGKTGQRTCVIIESYPHLMNYLNSEHGYADDLNAPLFLNSSNKDFGERLLYQGAFSTIKTAGKRAGIGGWGWEYLPGGKRKWKHLRVSCFRLHLSINVLLLMPIYPMRVLDLKQILFLLSTLSQTCSRSNYKND